MGELVSLGVMATPTKQIAIWNLEVLKEERKREPDFMKCRIERFTLGEVMEKHHLTSADIDDGLRFLGKRNLYQVYPRLDKSQAAWITDDGLEYLDAYYEDIETERVRRDRETALATIKQERESDHTLWRYWCLADWGERFGIVSFLFAVFLVGYLSASNHLISRVITLIRDVMP